MNMAGPERFGGGQARMLDPTAAYQAELDAARNDLHAEKSELEQLLAPIHETEIARQHVPGLLKQAYSRLSHLRASLAGPARLTSEAAEITALVKCAEDALHTGEGFSLEEADRAFEAASRRCLALGNEPEVAARMRAGQARIAALRQDYRRAAELFAQAAATPGLEAPSQWQYQKERASVLEDLGREFGDNAALEQAIKLYETTILALAPRTERPDDWATAQNNLGNALGVLGQRQRGTRMLERSITAFENALSERSRDRLPLDWAATQNNLGNALGILAQRQGDTEMLEKAIEAFESALEIRTQEKTPQDWATTQNNLGAALLTLGQRKKDTKILKKSVDAYKNVLQEWTRERVPLEWAMTLNNLGTALRAIGEHRKGPRTLEQAVAAYRSALAERGRERVPRDWAMTQNNLGAALQKLGERQGDSRILAEAVAAYENALEEWTRERMPMVWAMTMANLGVARRTLAEQAQDVEVSRRAVADLKAAAEVFHDASHAQYYELAEEQLAKARAVAAGLSG
jgi:tetratricopeptide (TPR) repeat protein